MDNHRPQLDLGRTAVVIPSLGSATLTECLDAVAALDPAPDRTIIVLSGGAERPANARNVEVVSVPQRLGFAAAVNLGFRHATSHARYIAVLNDDAMLTPNWLGVLVDGLEAETGLAAVQGTITDRSGDRVDGRGIDLDRWLLPIQLDRGVSAASEPTGRRPILAVSGTAALFRTEALKAAAAGHANPFDPHFGSYHEDLDLGLRLNRLGWHSAWIGGAPTRHVGSTTGRGFPWRHPWWVLANRWRACSGNLSASALIRGLPRMARGELRAVRTLTRDNVRSLPASAAVLMAWPALVVSGWRRNTPGPRLTRLPESV